MKEKWFAFFKSGTHTDSQGRTKEFKNKDLDKIAENYKNRKDDAPLVIGHPKENAPAWGWIEDVKRVGEYLFAKPKDLAPEFKDWIKKRRFKKVSMSIARDNILRHIGFLGAAAPAVKGLPDVSFKETELEAYDFAEFGEMGEVARIFQNIREWFIEKHGKEVADKIISSWDVDYLQILDKPKSAVKDNQPEYSTGTARRAPTTRKEDSNMSDKTFTEDELKAKLKEHEENLNKNFSEQLSKKDEELEAEKEKTANFKESQRKKKISDFMEKMKSEGKLTPAEEKLGLNAEFLETLNDQEVLEFSDSSGEGDGKKKETQLSRVMHYLENRGKVIEFSEIAGEGDNVPAGEDNKREKLIADFMEQNKCDYKEASIEVSKRHPRLFDLGKEE